MAVEHYRDLNARKGMHAEGILIVCPLLLLSKNVSTVVQVLRVVLFQFILLSIT